MQEIIPIKHAWLIAQTRKQSTQITGFIQECICFNSTILVTVPFASIRGIVKFMYYLFTSAENWELDWKDKVFG